MTSPRGDQSMTSTFREFARRISMLLHRERFAKELEDEMQLHLELRQQQQVEAGIAPKEAQAAAHRRFGNPTLIRERSYTAWGWSWLEGLLQDALYGLRAMLRSPGVTIVALLSLALGIGANTAIFSLMDAVMLRSLPVKSPQQFVMLGTADSSGIRQWFRHHPALLLSLLSRAAGRRIRSSPKQPPSSACATTCMAPSRVANKQSRCTYSWSPAHTSHSSACRP